jgi:dihydroorotate dehydrogenase subfamily 2
MRERIIFLRNSLFHFLYTRVLKRWFFLFNAEHIHDSITRIGKFLGSFGAGRGIVRFFFSYTHPSLEQDICGIHFKNPIGLAAGFDYNAKLSQILPSFGFGFNTVGTITHMSYGGNPPPMLGRLPKSKSLLVNKGFKNNGAEKISQELAYCFFTVPLGVSIGRTNSPLLKTAEQSIEDIATAYSIFEKASVKNSYYELNISCPNLLFAAEDFSDIKNLELLLQKIDTLHISKPIFVKMPIEKTNEHTQAMLEVIRTHPAIMGVIFGNLQKDKQDPSLDQSEVVKFKRGYFSGKPCKKRSNELIKLAFKEYGKKLIIIGCGGVFSAEDAYKKIRNGASLVQMITGMIYEGPQAISAINQGLVRLLKKDGFSHISEAIGIDCH